MGFARAQPILRLRRNSRRATGAGYGGGKKPIRAPLRHLQGANTHAHLIRPSGAGLIALAATWPAPSSSQAAYAVDGGGISFSVIKAGIVIGGLGRLRAPSPSTADSTRSGSAG